MRLSLLRSTPLWRTSATPPRPQVLFERELHRLDVLGRPGRFKQLVCPPQRRNVKYHFLPEVMIEPEELQGEDLAQASERRGAERRGERLG